MCRGFRGGQAAISRHSGYRCRGPRWCSRPRRAGYGRRRARGRELGAEPCARADRQEGRLMANMFGVIAGAILILISVSLHEAGHMGTAKAFKMKVTRFFVGFGPTLFSRRRGETEYGVKGIPLGGFVKIVGMTPQDEDADDPKAMWRFPVWKRTIVMSAGSIVHFI